mmetsp:Transcript_19000/g.32677  ORF Transcript_19000/g.32677 Transcript_19000/m.32677 type:complete len:503 (-) Transcript_19000:76-1584(-)
MSWAGLSGNPSIPKSERKMLLDGIGVFDVPVGEEEVAARKSNYYFRTAEQVQNWDATVLKRYRDKRNAAMGSTKNNSPEKDSRLAAEKDPSISNQSLHERVIQATKERKIEAKSKEIDSEKERQFFLKNGAVVAATVTEREKRTVNFHGFYTDGRPVSLCRISNCYSKTSSSNKQFLCSRHFNMIDTAARCDPSLLAASGSAVSVEASTSDKADSAENNPVPQAESENSQSVEKSKSEIADSNSNDTLNYQCSYCEEKFDSYKEAAKHEKDCGSVDEATAIPARANFPSQPPWVKVPLPGHLHGEAKVLAEHYRCMVWKTAMLYRQMADGRPKANNKCISAALGKHKRATFEPFSNEFQMSQIKFPCYNDEIETIKLFRCCGGPLAATLSGRAKLLQNGGDGVCYGDQRELKFCRVAGCRMTHEYKAKDYFCDWHYCMIAKVNLKEVTQRTNEGKRKLGQADLHSHEEGTAMKLSKAAAAMKRCLSDPRKQSSSPELKALLD